MEIEVRDGSDLLVGTHYFPPDTEVGFLRSFFNCLEKFSRSLD
jgi:hypothetical protein